MPDTPADGASTHMPREVGHITYAGRVVLRPSGNMLNSDNPAAAPDWHAARMTACTRPLQQAPPLNPATQPKPKTPPVKSHKRPSLKPTPTTQQQPNRLPRQHTPNNPSVAKAEKEPCCTNDRACDTTAVSLVSNIQSHSHQPNLRNKTATSAPWAVAPAPPRCPACAPAARVSDAAAPLTPGGVSAPRTRCHRGPPPPQCPVRCPSLPQWRHQPCRCHS